MKHIDITIKENYKSIPSGFVWNNIPQFAIITGINGVGKTQLLDILKQQEKNGMQINIPFDTTNEDGIETNLVVPSQQTKSQDLSGLISYFHDTDNRLSNIANYKGAIKSWHNKIEWINSRIKEDVDGEERHSLNHERMNLMENIKSYKQIIRNTSVFSYEEELKDVSIKSEKDIEDITEEDIRKYANPYFNDFSEIDDFEKYIRQEHEEYKENLAIAADKRDFERVNILADQEKPYQIINRLFFKYGFYYFTMLNPFPESKERKGEILFLGKRGEFVDFNALSSGEQMIVKFIILSLGRNIAGHRINTLILDEPDAHLHPTMCKMMVEILHEISQPKELGGGDIRVIITTHSPSTVAFAPEESLFVIENNCDGNKIIKPTTVAEAEYILSEGIFTFDKAMSQFTIAANTKKNNLLFVEGKTDVLHLNKAMEILGYDLDVEIIDMHDAGALGSFIKSAPHKLFGKKKMIALFDCDDKGKKTYNDIKGNDQIIHNSKIITAEQCENKSFAMIIQSPKNMNEYCPVEFLYPYDYLREKEMLIKREIKNYQSIYKAGSSDELYSLANEFEKETSLRPFTVDDKKKNIFAEAIKNETRKELFANFAPTLDVIKTIIGHSDEEALV